jgi:hypothetical protein
VNQIALEKQDDAVKRFVLSLPRDPGGAVLELDGHTVAWVFPAAPATDNGDEPWTQERNRRRCELIDREIDGTLTPAEAIELHRLQNEMLRYRRRVAPLPLEDARKLHDELLAKAAAASADE